VAEIAAPGWRAPQLLVAALGANLWLTVLVVPALYFRAAAVSPAALVAACVVAAALLGAGVFRRSRLLLLLLFPASLTLGPLVEPGLAGPAVYSPLTLLPCAAALLLHLGGSLWLCSLDAAPAAPRRIKPLAPALLTPLPRGGLRPYRVLAVVAAAFPTTLLAAVHYRPGAAAQLERSFGASAPAAAAVLTLFALGLWLGLFLVYFVRPLAAHLDGDRLTRAEEIEVRRRLAVRRPRLTLYLTMLVALALMAALLALRYR
jgi:hypothetical protein